MAKSRNGGVNNKEPKKFAKTSLNVKFLGCDYLLVQWCMKVTLVWEILHFMLRARVFHEYLIFVGINKNVRFVQYNNACGVDVFYELQLFICL